jgi:hypothetical protein
MKCGHTRPDLKEEGDIAVQLITLKSESSRAADPIFSGLMEETDASEAHPEVADISTMSTLISL